MQSATTATRSGAALTGTMHAKRATSLALAAVVALAVGTHAVEAKGRHSEASGWRERLGGVKRAALAWEADLAMPRHEVEALMLTVPAVREAYVRKVKRHKESHPYERSRPFALGGLLAWTGAFAAVAAGQSLSAGDIAPHVDSAWRAVEHVAPFSATIAALGVRIALADRLRKPHLEGLRAAAIAAVAASDATRDQGPGSRVLVSKRLRDVVTLLERATSGS